VLSITIIGMNTSEKKKRKKGGHEYNYITFELENLGKREPWE
jgi:hypothetical protein